MPKTTYIYKDPSSFTSGQTPYGTYDADSTFQSDIVSVTKWVAKRLGHPVLQLEIPSGSIYACFEEAINEYSTHINNYNIKNWMWEQYGEKSRISGSLSTGSANPVTPSLGPSIGLSEKYGQVVNMDGNIDLKKGHIVLSGSVQDYDLQSLSKKAIDFSGAEIFQAIIEGMYIAFNENREFTTSDIMKGLNEIIPLAQLEKKKIQTLQQWALSGRIRTASSNV